MQRVLSAGFCFRGAYLATRIPCNTYVRTYVRTGRKEAITWIRSGGGGRGSREPFETVFSLLFPPRLPVWWLVSTHRVAPMKRWRTANARRQHIPVLPNGPRYTPRIRTFPRVFFSPRASWIVVSTLEKEREKDTMSRWRLGAFEIKR